MTKERIIACTGIILLVFTAFTNNISAQNISEWREENRTGISAETGLLASWPVKGPALIWSYLDLPKGNSSVAFGTKAMFTTGTRDADDILIALDMNGNKLWEVVMGRAWNESFPESRATPTVEGNRVYTCSGMGDLACFDADNGKANWTLKASELYKGTFGSWGIAESLLLDGDKLYFSPGGPETMTIALNKNTGELIWKSPSLDNKPSYVSPILVDYGGKRMIINVSTWNIYAVNAANGEILWKVPVPVDKDSNWDPIMCVTPLYKDGRIYVTAGYDRGALMVGMSENGEKADIIWYDSVLDVHHGGVVLLNGYIYGSNWLNNSTGNWCCVEWATGKKMWEEKWKCKGSIISAEGKLYMYDEKQGNIGLVNVTPERFELISSFRVTEGDNGPYWAHPVIHQGRLYLRHNNALMVYDIKAQ